MTSFEHGRVSRGSRVAPRELVGIDSTRVPLPAPQGLTHLQFRRFASCPICNVHLRSVALRHDEIRSAGVREIVVFHSTVEAMLPHHGELPFDAVADPKRRLYAEFGVGRSWRALLHPRAWTAPLKPHAWQVARRQRAAGRWFSTGGDEVLSLPAEFLIEPDGRVVAGKYGRHAADQWSVDDLLALAASVAPHSR